MLKELEAPIREMPDGEFRYFSGRTEHFAYRANCGTEGDHAYVLESELRP